MKRTAICPLTLLLLSVVVAYPQGLPEWNSPAVTQINGEKMHASMMLHPVS